MGVGRNRKRDPRLPHLHAFHSFLHPFDKYSLNAYYTQALCQLLGRKMNMTKREVPCRDGVTQTLPGRRVTASAVSPWGCLWRRGRQAWRMAKWSGRGHSTRPPCWPHHGLGDLGVCDMWFRVRLMTEQWEGIRASYWEATRSRWGDSSGRLMKTSGKSLQ